MCKSTFVMPDWMYNQSVELGNNLRYLAKSMVQYADMCGNVYINKSMKHSSC